MSDLFNVRDKSIVITGGGGVLCGTMAPALAKAVLTLFEMTSQERASLGENGHNYFMANFHIPDRVSELTAHLEDLVAQR